MESLEFPISAGQLGIRLGARLVGDESLQVTRLAPITGAPEGTLTFFDDRKFSSQLESLKRVVLLTKAELVQPDLPVTYLVVDDPHRVFAGVARGFVRRPREVSVHETAVVDPSAVLEAGAGVGPYAIVGPRARIGRGVSIGSHCVIGEGVTIGDDTLLYPRVTVLAGVALGNRVVVFPGAVLGSDGFGYLPGRPGDLPTEVPQIGTVVIEDDVRIGALCTVDRGTIGETRVGAGTKLDDHVHIGHNTRVGRGALLCGQAGISGSVTIGDGAILGGQVGVADNVRVGKGSRIGGSSTAFTDVADGESVFLVPAVPLAKALSITKYMRRLPEIWSRLKRLEERVGGEPE